MARQRRIRVARVLAACAALGACGPPSAPPQADLRALSGGETTVFDTTRDAYSRPARNLDTPTRERFFVGNAIFNRTWVVAPASTSGMDGLGPRFHAPSCSSCHFKDGRGAPPATPDVIPVALLLRLSIPGADENGAPLPEPTYGGQLATRAIPGVPPDARVRVRYEELPGSYADGEPFTLRAPTYELSDFAYGPPRPDLLVSPRVAPPMIGMGLLEAVPEREIAARADPDDLDGDGISGRVNRVYDVKRGRHVLGRFGWKANQPDIEQQVAGALLGDIGITSSIFPEETCMPAMEACRAAPSGGDGMHPEIDAIKLDALVHYSRTLAVPARRDLDDPQVRRGERLFEAMGCAKCHIPRMRTGEHPMIPALTGQEIQPFTDLLLHDMGDGLADGRPDFEATGREWRTPPLWGLGLSATVGGHDTLLHDGRARGPAEAILWHGGEGEASREAFRRSSRADREAILRFLRSL